MKRILHQLRLVPMSPCYVWACVEIEAGAACGVEQVALVAKARANRTLALEVGNAGTSMRMQVLPSPLLYL